MGKSSGQTSSTSSGPPAQVLQQYQNVTNSANQQAQAPLQQYSGPIVAGFTPQQDAAFTTIQNAQGVANPYIDAASQLTMQGASPVTVAGGLGAQQIDQLMGQGVGDINQASGLGDQAAQAGSATSAVGQGVIGQLGAATNYGAQSAQAGSLASPMASAAMQGLGGVNAETSLANENSAIGSPYGQQVSALGAQAVAASQASPAAIAQWESPYTQQVVDSTQAQFNNQNEQQQQQLIGNAASQGAWGGDRSAVAQAVLAGQQQTAEAPVIAGLENTGYTTAEGEMNTQQQQQEQTALAAANLGLSQQQLAAGTAISGGQLQNAGANTAISEQGLNTSSALGAGQLANATANTGLGEQSLNTSSALGAGNLQLGAGQQLNTLAQGQQQQGTAAEQASGWLAQNAGYGMGNLGNEAQNTALSGANAQLQAGALQQQQNQEYLNVPYEQFQQAQAYPFQTLSWLSNISEGLGSGSGGTSSTTYPGASTASQLGGLGVAGLAAYGASGGFAARGGAIKDRKHFDLGGGVPTLSLPPGMLNGGVPDMSVSPVTGLGAQPSGGQGMATRSTIPNAPQAPQQAQSSPTSSAMSGLQAGKAVKNLVGGASETPTATSALSSYSPAGDFSSAMTGDGGITLGAPAGWSSPMAQSIAQNNYGSLFPGANAASEVPNVGTSALTSGAPATAAEAAAAPAGEAAADAAGAAGMLDSGAGALGAAGETSGLMDTLFGAGEVAADAGAATEAVGAGEVLADVAEAAALLARRGGRIERKHRDTGGGLSGGKGGGSAGGGKGGGQSAATQGAYPQMAYSSSTPQQAAAAQQPSYSGGKGGGYGAPAAPVSNGTAYGTTSYGVPTVTPGATQPSAPATEQMAQSGKFGSSPSSSYPSQGYGGGKGGGYGAPSTMPSYAPPAQQGGTAGGSMSGSTSGAPTGAYGFSVPQLGAGPQGGYTGTGANAMFNPDGSLNTSSTSNYSPPPVSSAPTTNITYPTLSGGQGPPVVTTGTFGTVPNPAAAPGGTINDSAVDTARPDLQQFWNNFSSLTPGEQGAYGNPTDFNSFLQGWWNLNGSKEDPQAGGSLDTYLSTINGGYTPPPTTPPAGGHTGGRIHRDMGGSTMPGASLVPGTASMAPGLGAQANVQQYSGMPADQLRQMAVRFPPNTPQGQMIQKAIQTQMMHPSTSSSLGNPAMGLGAQGQPPPAPAARGGRMHFDDAGAVPDADPFNFSAASSQDLQQIMANPDVPQDARTAASARYATMQKAAAVPAQTPHSPAYNDLSSFWHSLTSGEDQTQQQVAQKAAQTAAIQAAKLKAADAYWTGTPDSFNAAQSAVTAAGAPTPTPDLDISNLAKSGTSIPAGDDSSVSVFSSDPNTAMPSGTTRTTSTPTLGAGNIPSRAAAVAGVRPPASTGAPGLTRGISNPVQRPQSPYSGDDLDPSAIYAQWAKGQQTTKPIEHQTYDKTAFANSPWLPMMVAGLGIMSGRSPQALANVGAGGLEGLKAFTQQQKDKQSIEDKNADIDEKNIRNSISQNEVDQNARRFASNLADQHKQYNQTTDHWYQEETDRQDAASRAAAADARTSSLFPLQMQEAQLKLAAAQRNEANAPLEGEDQTPRTMPGGGVGYWNPRTAAWRPTPGITPDMVDNWGKGKNAQDNKPQIHWETQEDAAGNKTQIPHVIKVSGDGSAEEIPIKRAGAAAGHNAPPPFPPNVGALQGKKQYDPAKNQFIVNGARYDAITGKPVGP